MYDPRENAHQLGVAVEHHPLAGEHGRYIHARRLIVLRPGLTARIERCTLAHEVVHAEYRDEDTHDELRWARQEWRADRLAARRLIEPASWDAAWRIHRDPGSVAVELGVVGWVVHAYARDLRASGAA